MGDEVRSNEPFSLRHHFSSSSTVPKLTLLGLLVVTTNGIAQHDGRRPSGTIVVDEGTNSVTCDLTA